MVRVTVHRSSLALNVADVDSAFYSDLSYELIGDGPRAELTGDIASNEATGGPWAPGLQHGGPPNALLVLIAETLAAHASGRNDLIAVRLAAEFLGPVPVGPLQLRARVERLSRTAALITTSAGAGDRTSLQSRIWLLAPGEQPPERPQPCVAPESDPLTLAPFGFDNFPYAQHLDWRRVSGGPFEPGPAACWISARVPLLAGHELTGLQRTALCADSASGISSELAWDRWSFANVDLDLHLIRPPVGEWLLLDCRTDLGAGVAMAGSQISDRLGPVGSGLQTLLVRRV